MTLIKIAQRRTAHKESKTKNMSIVICIENVIGVYKKSIAIF